MAIVPTSCESRDILAKPWLALFFFWLPIVAIIVAGNSRFSNASRTIVWTVALVTMGAACIANARRCGRVHCFITGPFFVLMALITLLYGLSVLPLGSRGWNIISLAVLIGAIVLCCLPEMIWGKYRKIN
jgi:hypothetical protein